jgi:hypothetical protein
MSSFRAWIGIIASLGLAGCGGVIASASDAGHADIVEAGVDAGVDATPDAPLDALPPDDGAPTDAPPTDAPLPDSPGCSELVPLAPPTFTPPDGTSLPVGSQITINPPAGFPPGGTIYFTTNGTIPTHSSSVYIGPIQVNSLETIFAIAAPPDGFCLGDSPPVHASYTIVSTPAGAPTPSR